MAPEERVQEKQEAAAHHGDSGLGRRPGIGAESAPDDRAALVPWVTLPTPRRIESLKRERIEMVR
jgi:hypothetical protein